MENIAQAKKHRADDIPWYRALIIDYVPEHRLPKTRAFLKWGLRAATLTVAVGLYEFETNDVGLTEAIKRIWKA
jgi:succinate dehydrogenase (ubiquinone) membrane anchor subunit